MKAVSVIVPCYRIDPEYFSRLMKSILHQTIGLEQLEIILVNDASPDDTFEHLKKYEEQHPNEILVVNCEENGGPGSARTIGLNYASGEYVAFADQDDWLDLAMYQTLYEKAREYQCDLVKCGWSREDTYKESDSSNIDVKGHLWNIATIEERNEFLRECPGGYWSAIYQREMLITNQIFFPKHLAYDDNFFAGLIPFYAKRTYMIDLCMYHWFVNTTSISMGNDLKKHCDRMKIELLLLKEYHDRGIYESYREYIEYMFFQRFFLNTMHTIITRMGELPFTLLLEMREILYRNIVDIEQNALVRDKKEYLFGPGWVKTILAVEAGGCPKEYLPVYQAIGDLSFMEILHRSDLTEDEWKLTQFCYMRLQQYSS